jgi:CheY-like chemotaxis protein
MATPTHTAEIEIQTPRESNAATPELSNVPPSNQLVLLAEDEPIIREYMESVLRELGYIVVKAADGEEALGLFKQIPGMMIDLLLTDIVMPKMNGKELAYRIGLLSPGTKVLFCSAYPEKLASRNGMIDPRVPFLQKPVKADTLAAKVREVLDQPEEDLPDERLFDEIRS